jgi:hypothetical protein
VTTCAQQSDGAVLCWGYTGHNGGPISQPRPLLVDSVP